MYLDDIFSTLRQVKAGTLLQVFQVAFTFAVLVNLYAMIDDYRKQVNKDHGFKDEDSLLGVTLRPYNRDSSNRDGASFRNQIERDLAVMRGIVDVKSVSMAHEGIPLQNNFYVQDNREFLRKEGQEAREAIQHTRYTADVNTLELLGIDIVAGRAFTAEDVRWVDNVEQEGGPIILTQVLADTLFPDGDALGQRVTLRDGHTVEVIGIAKSMASVWWAPFDDYSSFLAARSNFTEGYLVRVNREGASEAQFAARKTAVIQALSEGLYAQPVEREVLIETIAELRVGNLGRFIIINSILGAIGVLLVVVTALGNYGQMSYTVFKRTKQIGIRRALGATRSYILKYFLTESAVITVLGLLPGVLLMIGLNFLTTNALGYGRFTWDHAVICVVFMFVLSWVSALVPISRAMMIPPAIATRTV